MQILDSQDLNEIFSNSLLFEKNSFYAIDKKTKTYDTSISFVSYIEYAKYIRSAYLNGHTIIVKNLEIANAKIQKECLKFGLNVNVHMYLVPPGGTDSFDYHTDDRDVYVVMVYGKKTFVKMDLNKECYYNLSEGQQLFIAKGELHKAIPDGPSCLLSFGVESEVIYSVPYAITSDDLKCQISVDDITKIEIF